MKFQKNQTVPRPQARTWLLAALSVSAMGNSALAQTNNVSSTRLDEVVIEGRDDSMVGIADSASQGTIGYEQLQLRTIARPGEVMETVPGLILTQHSGGGKGNQFFMRGMNLDHGTDFSTDLDGMPINLPSHGHGQGYTDLNIMIPELVQRLNYKKGVYYAEEGDFSSAGAADIEYFKVLPMSLAHVEAGSFNYARGVFASSPKVGPGNLLYALEAMHNDGPWDNPENFRKLNGVLRYSQGDDSRGFSIMAMGYGGDWDGTDQIPQAAIDQGVISDEFGSLNTSTGGRSQRYSLQAEWHRADENSATKIMGYGFLYNLDLFSDFSYFLNDPVNGDQFHQHDDRIVTGAKASHTWYHEVMGKQMENTVGLQIRNDNIHNGLFASADRQSLAQIREDDVWQFSLAPYLENKTQWGEKVRSVLGIRADYYHFDVDSDFAPNSGTADDIIASPKGSVVFGPWAKTELYVSGGLGFHSNDGRGVTSRTDPATGMALSPADPLVQTYGAEIGVRTTIIPNLHSTLSLWWLDIDSELLFVGDAGVTDTQRPSRRYGMEWANYYTPTKWLTVDADFSLSESRFQDNDPVGDYIPGSIETVVAAGITFHDLNGFFGGLRLRYFGPRPLTEDNTVRSDSTLLLSAHIGYQFNKHWSLKAEVFNLLNRDDHEIDYFYESRLQNEPINPDPALNGGYERVHFHPVDPIHVRIALTARF